MQLLHQKGVHLVISINGKVVAVRQIKSGDFRVTISDNNDCITFFTNTNVSIGDYLNVTGDTNISKLYNVNISKKLDK